MLCRCLQPCAFWAQECIVLRVRADADQPLTIVVVNKRMPMTYQELVYFSGCAYA